MRYFILATLCTTIGVVVGIILQTHVLTPPQPAYEPEKVELIEIVVEEQKAVTGEIMTEYSQEEIDMVCAVVMAEARGESREGQMAVAQVIKSRAEAWGMSIEEVVTAPSQFANPYQGEPTDSVKGAVSEVFLDDVEVFEGYVTHFHADWVSPSWAEEKTFVGKIGVHMFYV